MSAWSAVAVFVGSNSRNAPSRRKRLIHDEVEQPLDICDSCSFELFRLAHQQQTEVIKSGPTCRFRRNQVFVALRSIGSEGYRTGQRIDQPRHQALQPGSLAFLAAYARRWPRNRCRVARNRRNRKTACASVRICGRRLFFSTAGCDRPDTAVNTERFIFAPTDE
jgi:hypothetical protein